MLFFNDSFMLLFLGSSLFPSFTPTDIALRISVRSLRLSTINMTQREATLAMSEEKFFSL